MFVANILFSLPITQPPPILPTNYLFSHGIAHTAHQVYLYTKTYQYANKTHTNKCYIIDGPLSTFNYPDATTGFWRVNFWKTNLAQKHDIDTLAAAYHKLKHEIQQTNNHASIVLVGLSRGASTAINFMARHNPYRLKRLS